jgi:hypothetical protein
MSQPLPSYSLPFQPPPTTTPSLTLHELHAVALVIQLVGGGCTPGRQARRQGRQEGKGAAQSAARRAQRPGLLAAACPHAHAGWRLAGTNRGRRRQPATEQRPSCCPPAESHVMIA